MSGFWSNIFTPSDRDDSFLALLSSVPVFTDLSRKELKAVERILYRRTYTASETIFAQGDPGMGMYIIAEGDVEIRSEPENKVLTTLSKGSFFGEIALLNDDPRSATAIAKNPATLWGFFQPELIDLLERNSRLGVKILFSVARITGKRLVALDGELRRYQNATVGSN